MARFPVIIYIGAALLGKISGEMIFTEPVVIRLLTPMKPVIYAVELAFAAGVILYGRYRIKRDLADRT